MLLCLFPKYVKVHCHCTRENLVVCSFVNFQLSTQAWQSQRIFFNQKEAFEDAIKNAELLFIE